MLLRQNSQELFHLFGTGDGVAVLYAQHLSEILGKSYSKERSSALLICVKKHIWMLLPQVSLEYVLEVCNFQRSEISYQSVSAKLPSFKG